jgi:RecA/RadA recombinase
MSIKPFDVSKFRKSITKNIDGLSVGFHDPTVWISTGNYCLNYLISGRFDAGIPLGKFILFAGAPGSGKSLISSGNIVADAQKKGIFVILIDSENALDNTWLTQLGVDTSEDKLLKLNMSMIDDVAKVISNFIKEYRIIPENERPKVLFVIDSLGMLLSPTQVDQFESGDMKGDMGIKAKQLKLLISNCVNMIGDLDIGIVATNHVYCAKDKYSDDVISGGLGALYAASIIVSMSPYKLKEGMEEGKKPAAGADVLGIRAICKVIKTRYNKPFESVEIMIPYDKGINPYSGLYELFVKQKLLVKEGNSYVYTDLAGVSHKYFHVAYLKNKEGILDLIMSEFNKAISTIKMRELSSPEDIDETATDDSEEISDNSDINE